MIKENYCKICGDKLKIRYLEKEGDIPYCENCKEYRFPSFNTAISAIVYSPKHDKIALIQQYGKKRNILVAGYINQGEGAEHALCREIQEELGLKVKSYSFNASEYFEPSNTLMVNFACTVDSDELTHINDEIDYIRWYSPEEALEAISHGSLAEKFLMHWLAKLN